MTKGDNRRRTNGKPRVQEAACREERINKMLDFLEQEALEGHAYCESCLRIWKHGASDPPYRCDECGGSNIILVKGQDSPVSVKNNE